ncbi:mechanosensitive ion channel family protein [Azovibrio restrictus]|uniref:mechanosensitive ion channel family protein n=1 Tax=Azovibrio restrictus TaxID=146938 RepID=UPI0026E94DF8|nr:mechanosensitive ion channel domain-containing protein [Azovibrio restrictus]MDD3483540.1 mechanosensitive ion channel [Azovibrio restrictus]
MSNAATASQTTTRLLMELWDDFQHPDFYWQILILLGCLGLAWLISRRLRQRLQGLPDRMGLVQALVGQAFPLLAVLFLVLSKAGAQEFLPVHMLKVAVPLLLSLAVVRAVHHMLQRSFPRARWLGSIGRLFSILIWGWLALYLSGAADEVIRTLEMVGFTIGKQQINLWMILNGLVVVMLTLLASLWAASLVEARLMGATEMDSSLRIVLVRVSKALFILVSVLLSFSLVGIDITALSVFTGALGVGLGLGLQKIASNYVSGFIILLDRSIRLGNIIQLDAQTSGTVTQITTRYTVLKNMVGLEFIVPNEALVANIVQNQTYSDTRVRVATSVSVAYDADLERVVALLEDIARAQPRVLQDPPPRALVTMFADSGINIDLGFWINDPDQGSGALRSDINMEIWRRFRQEGIEIPYPQREVRVLGPAAVAGVS